MELLWLVCITLIAICCAYWIGGRLDRSAARREAVHEEQRRARWMQDTARFAASCAGRLAGLTLLPRHAVPAAGRALMRAVLDETREDVSSDEWETMCRALDENSRRLERGEAPAEIS